MEHQSYLSDESGTVYTIQFINAGEDDLTELPLRLPRPSYLSRHHSTGEDITL